MFSFKKLSSHIFDISNELAALKKGFETIEKRVDDNRETVTGIHKLAANEETLEAEVGRLSKRVEEGLQGQGRRLGSTESLSIETTNSVKHLETQMRTVINRLDIIEKEPGQKYKDLIKQITGLVIAAIIGAIIAKFL